MQAPPTAPVAAPATYGELAELTRDTTHADWEPTLGDTYEILRYEPLDDEEIAWHR
jgi:hypothetical protein